MSSQYQQAQRDLIEAMNFIQDDIRTLQSVIRATMARLG